MALDDLETKNTTEVCIRRASLYYDTWKTFILCKANSVEALNGDCCLKTTRAAITPTTARSMYVYTGQKNNQNYRLIVIFPNELWVLLFSGGAAWWPSVSRISIKRLHMAQCQLRHIGYTLKLTNIFLLLFTSPNDTSLSATVIHILEYNHGELLYS